MKNFIPAASFLTLGAAGLAIATSVHAEGASKPWSLRAGLSGFYNDNVYTRSDLTKVDSFGFELSPGFSINLPVNDGQTTLSLSYDYILRYFDNREKSIDHNHLVDARLTHQFNSKNKVDVFDNFVQAQEPAQLGSLGGNVSLLLRAEGTNFRNIAGFDFTSQLTDRWSTVVGYRNSLYRFENVDYQKALDRTENNPSVNLRYLLTPTTTVGILYQYGITDFDGPAGNVGVVRDFTSHFVAGTLDHDFSPNLKGSLRAGIQITTFEKFAGYVSHDGVSPYVDGLLSYDFAAGSSLSFGVRHQVNVTDVSITQAVGGGQAGDPIRGSSATSGRLSLSHSFTPKLVGTVSGVYQYSTFIGGGVVTANGVSEKVDGASDRYASVDLNVSYQFTHYLSGRVGYSHDRVDSDLEAVGDLRVFSRNRVYLGVNFTY
jgi:Putative beta-barrel porin 2